MKLKLAATLFGNILCFTVLLVCGITLSGVAGDYIQAGRWWMTVGVVLLLICILNSIGCVLNEAYCVVYQMLRARK